MKTFAALALSPAAGRLAALLPTSSEQPLAADVRAYAFTYMFRGLVVMVAALSDYALAHSGFAAPWLPWMVLMPLAGMVQSIRARRQRKLRPAGTTAADKWMRLLQKSFVFTLLLALASATQIGWENAHPLILVLYGVVTLAAGRVLSFRPLQLGAAACIALGFASAAVSADTQLLLIAAAMLLSYVLPGYLLHAHSRRA